jgi:hypothetical protein
LTEQSPDSVGEAKFANNLMRAHTRSALAENSNHMNPVDLWNGVEAQGGAQAGSVLPRALSDPRPCRLERKSEKPSVLQRVA